MFCLSFLVLEKLTGTSFIKNANKVNQQLFIGPLIFFPYYPLNKKKQTLNFIKKGLVLLWQGKAARCPMCQCATAQGSRAGHTSAPGHRAWPRHLLSLLILCSSPCQANGPRRVAASPVWKPRSEPGGGAHGATEDHAWWNQGHFCFNYQSGSSPCAALNLMPLGHGGPATLPERRIRVSSYVMTTASTSVSRPLLDQRSFHVRSPIQQVAMCTELVCKPPVHAKKTKKTSRFIH